MTKRTHHHEAAPKASDRSLERAIAKAIAEPRRFRAKTKVGELLAMEPQAIDFSYLYTGIEQNDRTDDGVAIVTINGPLEHHATAWWDSYEAIVQRVEDAMCGEDLAKIHFARNFWRDPNNFEPVDTRPARAVILRIDSPGGEAAGSMWCHRKLRALRDAYGCPLYAYADEMACSAAYAIASAADEIWTPDTGQVGSIGVIATLFDRTEANARAGLNIELVTSGALKADNHADRPLEPEVVARMQEKVDALAKIFWKCVAKARSRVLDVDVSPDDIKALEAGVFLGADAVKVGIADGVASWDVFLKHVTESLDALDGFAAGTSAA